MDEIKTLVEAIANLPHLTLWVLIGFLGYKLATLASIYGVIRLFIVKMHDYLANRHSVREMWPLIRGVSISGSAESLEKVLKGLANVSKKCSIQTHYVGPDDVEWLKEAIEEKKQRDAK